LTKPVNRDQICLVWSPFWLKIGPYPSECDKKDLMHAIRSTFGALRPESSLVGKEFLHFGSSSKQMLQQCNYKGRKNDVTQEIGQTREFSEQKMMEVSSEMERTTTVEKPSILEIVVNYQNLGDLVPHSLTKILEDTLRGKLSKELIEDDTQGE
ncbi:hypothetical protein Goshw_021124, partial [Gossypium schwendimanii]|nr:hypothetical protein [Gossypium schwendimanii]